MIYNGYMPKLNPNYREKICVDCGNPHYVKTQHFKRSKRCKECQSFRSHTKQMESQRRYRKNKAKLNK